MRRYDVMRHWVEGFVAGIAPAGCDPTKDEHWQAGYLAGYKMRDAKNQALDEYLISTGREPQAKIRLAHSEEPPNAH
jgi:hypothetical protein